MRSCVLLSLLVASLSGPLAACTRYHAPPCFPGGGGGGSCENGFTCRMTECIAHRSLTEGELCSEDLQCAVGLVCPLAFFRCSRPCSLIYDFEAECKDDEVCAPAMELRVGKTGGGACVKPECKNDVECAENGGALTVPFADVGCVQLARRGGGLCLQTCEIGKRVADAVGGVDRCVSDLQGAPTHCGRIPTGDQVCLPAGKAKEGELCQLFPSSADVIDACSLNLDNNGMPGSPLVCTAPDGGASNLIDLRCRAE